MIRLEFCRHGVEQPRNPWTDGPAYITQCPIQPGNKFSQKVIFLTEEGTLWWHAHSNWSRATVHGAIIIYPKRGTSYPFLKPRAEVPIILGGWWKEDVNRVIEEFLESGGQPRDSNAYTINGQPGYFYPCSKRGGAYVSGAGVGVDFDNTTTTAILQYKQNYNFTPSSPPSLPYLPYYNDTSAAVNFSFSIKSLNSESHPASVPLNVSTRLVSTVSVNTFPCARNSTCEGPNGTRLAASMNNISFENPSIDILEAYFYRIPGIFGRGFPSFPPLEFNYTADYLPLELEIPKKGHK
ncbi:unnamed protein product [Fraxinus pennsylvanica]|uniref:Plastocyanin-like domain-containing protein n=1 Tax=Fraxinus pennsylvanica TaxID=56036 RepID=A0AAD2DR11_9LAMI|nr:unnamed protein product [Fraxinus pennsylvanica]